jgi:hypothetical protein
VEEFDRPAVGEVAVAASAQKSLEDQASPSLVPQIASSSSVYLKNEAAVLSRLRECYGPNVKGNQRLGRAEFDAIIRPTGDGERIIVEIKYIRKGFHQGWLTESLNSLAARTQLYSNTFSQKARGVLLIVLGPESRDSLNSVIAAASEKLRSTSSTRFNDLRITTLREAEIASVSCRDLKIRLGDTPA